MELMTRNILDSHFYGLINQQSYDHFLANRSDNDMSSVKSEDSEGAGSSETVGIKPRKTKFEPQSYHNCQFCGKWYRSKTSLGLHRRLECGKEPTFQCPFCPLKTHQKGNLQVHIKKKHKAHDQPKLTNPSPELGQSLGSNWFGDNRELNSELTITRFQPRVDYSLTNDPSRSLISIRPNKAHGITQFPVSALGIENERRKVRVRGLADIPADVEVTETKPSTDANKLPELTRILNSVDPVSPIVIDSFSIGENLLPAIKKERPDTNENCSDNHSAANDH